MNTNDSPTRFRLRAIASVALAAAFLSACGGGSSDAPVAAAPTPTPTINGVAAVGAALAGATIDFVCADGSPAATTTAGDGSFSVGSTGVTFPCVATASGGTAAGAANGETLYAGITATGTANVTTLSSLQVAYLAAQDPAAWVASLRAAPGGLAAR